MTDFNPDWVIVGPHHEVTKTTLYAWRSTRPPLPKHAANGCPNTGWVHEAKPPWRVITSTDPAKLAGPFEVARFTRGVEQTVDYDEWCAPYNAQFNPVHPCRRMPTRHCPAIYGAVCGERPCARYESVDEAPWLPELGAER